MITRYRHVLAVFLLLALATSSAEAQWQPHTIKVGDGQGGQVEKSAQINLVKVPGYDITLPYGLVQMDNGELAMTVRAWAGSPTAPLETRVSMIGFSKDGGNSWYDWRNISDSAWVAPLGYLGGGTLTTASTGMRNWSYDYGRSFHPSDAQPEQPNTNGDPFGMFGREGNEWVDYDANGNAAKILSFGGRLNDTVEKELLIDATTGYFRTSTDGGHTWQNEVQPPQWTFDVEYKGKTYPRGVSEGAVARAANGDVVAALRTDMHPAYYPIGIDNFEGTAISISHDEGQTWSELNHLFVAGRHHCNLQRTKDGALVLTLILRDDIRGSITGTPADLTTKMVGADALVSLDNGQTWNLDRRVTLDEFPNPIPWPNTCVGHVAAAVLSDGSMISIYGSHAEGHDGAVMIKWDPDTALSSD